MAASKLNEAGGIHARFEPIRLGGCSASGQSRHQERGGNCNSEHLWIFPMWKSLKHTGPRFTPTSPLVITRSSIIDIRAGPMAAHLPFARLGHEQAFALRRA